MGQYILQTILFQLVFLVVYDLLLKKETFFNYNRIYLMVTALLSLIIPLIKIDAFKAIVPESIVVSLPTIFLGGADNLGVNQNTLNGSETVLNSFWSWELLIIIGIIIAFSIALFKTVKIYKLISKNSKFWKRNFWLVTIKNSKTAFSVFNYVCLGERLNENDKQTILNHELVHVNQKHSIDLIFFEALRILFWFNPLVYMYQKRIATLHEYIADAEAIKTQSKINYYQNMLSQVFETKNMSFINTFYNKSLIKKRVIMLSKNKSKQKNVIKYLLLMPLICGMLVYTSCSEVLTEENHTAVLDTENGKTPLIQAIGEVKEQMQIQGYASDHEQKGLDLLLQAIKGNEFNPNLVNEVHAYEATKGKSRLTGKIANVFQQIQVQGNITDEEEKTLKSLLVLTLKDGLNDPFFEDVLDRVVIPFSIVEQTPLFPGCETESKANQKKCTIESISKHVNDNFNIKLATTLNLKGKQRIITAFKIDREGHIVDVKARAPHPDLAEEAKRVVQSLPKMIPGEQDGKKVAVPYSLPIVFLINE